MRRHKVTFESKDKHDLQGILEMPINPPLHFALFAHCFTCSKDSTAGTRICQALTNNGIAVLRFDFTGLGESDGDFSKTNFSSNIDDLIAAALFLKKNYQSPTLLIGHSLGGAAVLAAANQIPTSKAIVTVGAPSDPLHVKHLFCEKEKEILSKGSAEVDIAGRKFRLRKQFIEDLHQHDLNRTIGKLKKALLIFHSPQDVVVPIEEASKIYQHAKHPKSFISLDDADHLLTNKEDAKYVAATIAAWSSRYLQTLNMPSDKNPLQKNLRDNEVLVKQVNHELTNLVYTHEHIWTADEPTSFGGKNLGPNPYALLLSALGACTSMTIAIYAKLKKIPIKNINVKLTHQHLHTKDCQNCEDHEGIIEQIERTIQIDGDFSNEQHDKFKILAEKCPVHKTLTKNIEIKTKLI